MTYPNGIGDWKQTLNPITPVATPEHRQLENQKTTSAGSTNQTDQAKLSPASEMIAQAMGDSDVRLSKVEALQKAIADGTYSVPSSDVAGKIIQSLLE